MTRIPKTHPRFASLKVRSTLASAARSGLVVPEGLIAHGRGEAFDYFLGERTIPSAARAERAATRWLARAHHPVVSVNGNTAALAASEIAGLVDRLPGLRVEVNLFHRSSGRAAAVARRLRRAGVPKVLGVRPTRRIAGLPSDRGRVAARGIYLADVCLVPLEDGDRTAALRALGKRVIAIDLNPFSRTALAADIPIIDELRRALSGIARALARIPDRGTPGVLPSFDAEATLRAARLAMARRLSREGPERSSRRPSRGIARRSRRRL